RACRCLRRRLIVGSTEPSRWYPAGPSCRADTTTTRANGHDASSGRPRTPSGNARIADAGALRLHSWLAAVHLSWKCDPAVSPRRHRGLLSCTPAGSLSTAPTSLLAAYTRSDILAIYFSYSSTLLNLLPHVA